MTGGTLIVKMDNTYSMTKVAHDGYDLKDINLIKQWAETALSAEDLVFKYLEYRAELPQGDFDPYPLDRSTCVFTRSFKDKPSLRTAMDRMTAELMDLTENEWMDGDHPYMQLSCGYDDYILEINLNVHSFILNGNKV